MSQEVKEVTDIVKQLGGLKEKAKRVRLKMDRTIQEAHEAIDGVDQGIAEPLGDAVKELKDFLAQSTNRPPGDKE